VQTFTQSEAVQWRKGILQFASVCFLIITKHEFDITDVPRGEYSEAKRTVFKEFRFVRVQTSS
jgi:hypothetical protein